MRSLLRFLALPLCLTLPATALAQSPAQPPGVPAPPRISAPPEPLAPPRPKAPDESLPLGIRIATETLGGALAGTTGLAVGFLGGLLLADGVSCGFDDCNPGRDITLSVGAVGLGLGAASGVYLAGSLMDERGHYLPTLLGGLVGAGAPMAVLALSGGDYDNGVFLPAFLTLPVVGAILGYELSNPGPATRTAASASATVVLPTVGLAPGGGTLGLMGRF